MAVTHFDTSEVRRLAVDLSHAPAEVRRRAPVVIRKGLHDIERDGKVLAPVDTGNLEGSISTDVDGDGLGGVVGPTADYGAYVEYGTEPHVIRAHGGYLKFTIGGRTVFVRQVNHPGTAPQPYMGPAFDRNVPGVERALGQAGEDSVL
ncbi:MAG: hypothetical protein HOV66_28050 [Streptomycetaceae bacterium]|nr:hypothetical protein [Streptomycetaceae bacterium]